MSVNRIMNPEKIRFSTRFLGVQMFSFFINPTGWDSIGFSFLFWMIYVFLCEYEKNMGRGTCSLHFYRTTVRTLLPMLLWLALSVITLIFCFSEPGAIKIAFYYFVGAITMLEIVDMQLNKRETEWLLKMYVWLGIIASVLLFIQREPVPTYTNRFSIMIFGEIKDPNYFSAYLVLPCIVCLYHFLYKGVKLDGLKGCMIAIAVFMTGSRASFLALVMAITFLCLPALKDKRRIFSVVFFCIIAIIAVFMIMPEDLFARLLNFESYNDGSNRLRSSLWNAAIEIWLENPVFGSGQNVVLNKGVDHGALMKLMTHSTFFDMLAEFGIVGAVLFYMIPVKWFFKAWKEEEIIVTAGLVGTLATSMIISAQYSQYYWFNLAMFGVLLQKSNLQNR